MNKKTVNVGNFTVGNGKIYIQSMLNVPAYDIENSVKQAIELENAGCEILRAAIPDENALDLIEKIKNAVKIPLVADIHFDYKLALKSVERGIDKIRINPGNIGDLSKIRQVANACNAKKIPIRIGVNSGSVEKEILAKYSSPTPEALVESALNHVKLLNQCDFDDIVISIKSSDVEKTVSAYRILAQKCDYPLHLGVTEAGTKRMGVVKSAIGIGSLLLDGIGDTIRVSLTADPLLEVETAKDILKALGRFDGVNIISCPTCGRTEIDLISLVNELEDRLCNVKKNITVAVMGCVVNGPGEAKEADIGIAGGKGCAVLFKKGEVVRKIDEKNIVVELMKEIENL